MKYSKEKVEEILYNIQYQINNYYIKNHKLPDSIYISRKLLCLLESYCCLSIENYNKIFNVLIRIDYDEKELFFSVGGIDVNID